MVSRKVASPNVMLSVYTGIELVHYLDSSRRGGKRKHQASPVGSSVVEGSSPGLKDQDMCLLLDSRARGPQGVSGW